MNVIRYNFHLSIFSADTLLLAINVAVMIHWLESDFNENDSTLAFSFLEPAVT